MEQFLTIEDKYICKEIFLFKVNIIKLTDRSG